MPPHLNLSPLHPHFPPPSLFLFLSSPTKNPMVSSAMEDQGLVYNRKLSSVGPGEVTGPDSVFEPANLDLAMKLHYLRGVYYFGAAAFEGLNTLAVKEPMFEWLNQYPVTCGRLRRGESGRAYIKCNDCGVRFIEARCDRALDEWLETKDVGAEKLLCSSQIIGPELSFSPLVYVQLTKFKCGGVAVGLSWAHVLGDAFSAAEFMNMLGRVASGAHAGQPIILSTSLKKPANPNGPPKTAKDPLSIKRVDPVGDNWVHAAPNKIEAFSFTVTPAQLSQLHSKLGKNGAEFPPFEALSAVIWQCVARIRVPETDLRDVTVCRRSEQKRGSGALGNCQIVGAVKADFPVGDASLSELALLLQNEAADERKSIEDAVERDDGLSDFIVYGANLTFVDLEEAGFYEFGYRGQKPVSVSYRVDGVGEEGAVLVLPAGGKKGGGRYVVVMLPEDEIIGVQTELKRIGVMA